MMMKTHFDHVPALLACLVLATLLSAPRSFVSGEPQNQQQEQPAFKDTCPQNVRFCSPHNLCLACHPTCKYCQNLNNETCGLDDCMACSPPRKLKVKFSDGTGACVEDAESPGTCPLENPLCTLDNICTSCGTNCVECQSEEHVECGPHDCTKCADGYFLKRPTRESPTGLCKRNTSPQNIIARNTCPSSLYEVCTSVPHPRCETCPLGCVHCFNASSNHCGDQDCLKCSSGYSLVDMHLVMFSVGEEHAPSPATALSTHDPELIEEEEEEEIVLNGRTVRVKRFHAGRGAAFGGAPFAVVGRCVPRYDVHESQRQETKEQKPSLAPKAPQPSHGDAQATPTRASPQSFSGTTATKAAAIVAQILRTREAWGEEEPQFPVPDVDRLVDDLASAARHRGPPGRTASTGRSSSSPLYGLFYDFWRFFALKCIHGVASLVAIVASIFFASQALLWECLAAALAS